MSYKVKDKVATKLLGSAKFQKEVNQVLKKYNLSYEYNDIGLDGIIYNSRGKGAGVIQLEVSEGKARILMVGNNYAYDTDLSKIQISSSSSIASVQKEIIKKMNSSGFFI